MKAKKISLFILTILIFALSCNKKSDTELYGDITGKVKNSSDGEPISGAIISITPTNSSTTSGTDGTYAFTQLEPRQYSIEVSRSGFQSNSINITVEPGENRFGDILLTPIQPVLQVSTLTLDYGTDKNILPIEIRNNGANQLNWSVTADKPWITVNPSNGSTTAGVGTVSISIDRGQMGKTAYTGTVVVSSNGGSASIQVSVNVIEPSLNVSSTLLTFGAEQSILPLEINNIGGGQLNWSITTDKPWISANPGTGGITSGTSAVNIAIDRSQIGKSAYTGTVVVNSNGGTATINVTANVTGPLLSVTPADLNFGTTESEQTLYLSNIGVGLLSYNAVASQTWLSLQNATGTTTTDIKLMQVIVNRAGMLPGNYSGSVVINTNANNISIPVMFQVLAPAAPSIVIGPVNNLNDNSAQVSGNITSLGSSTVTQHGHCWGTSSSPTTASDKSTLGLASVTGDFTSELTELSSATTYYVRAYATNSVGTVYSSQIQITTDAGQKPSVTTAGISSISSTRATGGGNVTNQGGTAVTARGICWSTNPNPTTASNNTSDGIGTGTFISNLSGLSPATTYYVRAYATNTAGTAYGTQMQFSTDAGLAPAVLTNTVTNITPSTAACGGNVTAQGGTPVTARGVCWNTGTNPTISNSLTSDGSGTGSFNSTLTGLLPVTTYYVRSYATNGAGTSYGNQVQFTTESGQLPSVTTANISGITGNSATGGGNVTSQGTTSVSQRGVCWSTNPNPGTNDSHSANGSGTGSFTSNLTGLTEVTTYYVRAYATNSIGTNYGNEISFTTDIAPPVVTSGLMAYYTFNQQSAGDWTSNNDGIAINLEFSTSTPEGSGYSASFNGVNSYISIMTAFFSGTMDFCFSAWVKTSTNTFTFFNQNGGIYTDNGVAIDNNNKVYYAMNGLLWQTFNNPATALLDNNWSHFVYCRQGSLVKYYIDGTLTDSRSESGSMHANIKTNIGTNKLNNGYFFNGKMDNIRFYNRALSQSEITEIYNAAQ